MATLPNQNELSAMLILKRSFKLPITFIESIDSYKRKTPDLLIGSVSWELKSPSTAHLSMLEKRLNEALKQSKYIVMDLRHIAIDESKAIRHLTAQLISHKRVKRLLCIKKDLSVIALK